MKKCYFCGRIKCIVGRIVLSRPAVLLSAEALMRSLIRTILDLASYIPGSFILNFMIFLLNFMIFLLIFMSLILISVTVILIFTRLH